MFNVDWTVLAGAAILAGLIWGILRGGKEPADLKPRRCEYFGPHAECRKFNCPAFIILCPTGGDKEKCGK